MSSPTSVHMVCQNDPAYIAARLDNAPFSMQMVLRAYKFDHTLGDAHTQIGFLNDPDTLANDIKSLVGNGVQVYWKSSAYEVKVYKLKSGAEQWLIECVNGSCIGLTHADGKTVNGKPGEFYTN